MIFPIVQGEDDLIVQKGSKYVDLYSGNEYRKKDIIIKRVKNEYVGYCLKREAKHKLDGLIRGYNNKAIAIKNKGGKIRTHNGNKISSTREYWIDNLDRGIYCRMQEYVIHSGKYSIFPILVFYELTTIADEYGIIPKAERSIRKVSKRYGSKGKGIPIKVKYRFKNMLLYVDRMYKISTDMNSTEDNMKELLSLQNRFDIGMVFKIKEDQISGVNLRDKFVKRDTTISDFINNYK